ncbi:MAG: DUF6231 family protein [Pseudomonadota bacterium]|nr:DUF6231 family protein [Pseudomonadota bacterium]
MTVWPFDILPMIQGLAQEKPIERGLLIGTDCRTANWPADWQHCPTEQLLSLPFQQRYDLAVLQLEISSLSDEYINQGVTRLRDLLARRVLLVVTSADTHTVTQLRALGFSQIEAPTTSNQPQNDWQLWQFNILAYKQVPDWLNAKFWANPENWGKYRW